MIYRMIKNKEEKVKNMDNTKLENSLVEYLKDNNKEKLDDLILDVEKLIAKYEDNYLSNLGDKKIIENILLKIKNDSSLEKTYIKELAKKYNEKNNKHLIIEVPKPKKWTFLWLINLFKGKNKVKIDEIEFENAEKDLINEFTLIGEKIIVYLREINKIKRTLSTKKYDSIIETLYSFKNVNEELRNLVKNLKELRENMLSLTLKEKEIESLTDTSTKEENDFKILENSDVVENSNLLNEELQLKETEDKNTLDKDFHDTLLIANLFEDNVFRLFLKYCDENNLRTIADMKNFNFDKLDGIKGFGIGKKEKLIKRYNEIITLELSCEDNEKLITIKEINNLNKKECNILECYRSLDISILECFDKINKNLINQLQSIGLKTVEELNCSMDKIGDLVPGLGTAKIKYINLALEKLELEPNLLLEILIKNIKANNDYDILVKRAVENNTLQEIGEEYGVTRERIRQKEKKIILSLSNILDIFIKIKEDKHPKISSCKELLELECIGDEDIICLDYVLRNTNMQSVEYYEELDKFLINGSLEKLKEEIKVIISKLPDIININEELREYFDINEILKYSKLNYLVDIILSSGYSQVNNYLFKGSASKTKIYNFIVKEFFKDGITFSNEDDILKFQNILKEKFSIKENSERNIKAKIESYCILYDRGSYIHPDFVEIDEELLYYIKEYIDNSSQETLYVNQIFIEFEKELAKNGISNRYYLHGVLKYYFRGDYKFTKDTISRGKIIHDRNYIFNKYIKDKGQVVTKEELEENLKGWTPIMIFMALEECKYVLKWENGGFIHASLIKASLEDIYRIKDELDNLFVENKDSITDGEAFEVLNPKFNEFLKENSIDTKFKLFSVLEYILDKEYYFRRPYILRDKPKEAVSATYLMKKLFDKKNVLTMDELKQFCINLKINDTTRMAAINRLLKDMIEIEKDTFVLKETFDIEEEDIKIIKEMLLAELDKNEYLALKGIEDYSRFPNINLKWNQYLMKDICKNYIPEVKELKRQFFDKRYQAPVIVKEESNMDELLDLIIDILNTKFGNAETIEIKDLEKYLKENNIIYDGIPFEFYNCEEIKINDNKITLSKK